MHSPESRRLLVLAYEFPPAAGGGVRRIAKLAQFLPAAGWIPTVISADLVPGRPSDPTSVADVAPIDVYRLPARHIAAAIARALSPFKRSRAAGARGGGQSAKLSLSEEGRSASTDALGGPGGASRASAPMSTRLSRWMAVPDDAVLWSAPAVRQALRLHGERPFDAILSASPPYSTAVAGAEISRLTGLPLIVDMQDAWRDNPGLVWPTRRHSARSLDLERRVMTVAAAVVAVSEPLAEEARQLGAVRTLVMPNGFDPAQTPAWHPNAGGPPTVAFMGRFYGVTDPTPFFEGLALALDGGTGPDLRVEIVGPESPRVAQLVDRLGLQGRVRVHGYKPHAQALDIVSRADAGLLSIADREGAKAVYSSKLFEYLGIGVPVLLVGPLDGAAAALVSEARAGVVVAPGDVRGIAEMLLRLAEEKTAGRPITEPDPEVRARYEYPRQAAALGRLLDEATAHHAEAQQAAGRDD
jgi:glycosyltransferase involved in cell wall biosynthesis